MVAVDTNVLVRLLTNDAAAQAKRAAAVFGANTVFISKTVLMETEWVLRYSYELQRDAILHALRALAGLPNVVFEDEGQVLRALDGFAAGLDWADALHVASSARARRFVTFDDKLIKRAAGLGKPTVASV